METPAQIDFQGIEPSESVRQAIAAAESELGKDGRILVRPSGTEPLIRVMIEGKEEEHIRRLARRVADAIASSMP